ncbi:membrane or secreted protein [Rhodopirellula bahusiensis]
MSLFNAFVGCGPSGRDLTDAQWLKLQQEMQTERAEVGRQRDQLEADRREWDERERRHTLLASAFEASSLLLACVLPLAVILILLWPRPEPIGSQAVCEALLEEAFAPPEATKAKIEDTGRSTLPEHAAPDIS